MYCCNGNEYRNELLAAIRCCVDIGVRARCHKTAIGAIDALVGGLPIGDVTLLLGHSASGKSVILRYLVAVAARKYHVLYIPLQDGDVKLAIKKMLWSLAGISQEKDLESLSTTEYMALAEAAEQLADSQIGAHTIDSVLRKNLWDMIVTEFACDPDDDDVGEARGIVILDNVDMFNLGHNREEAMN